MSLAEKTGLPREGVVDEEEARHARLRRYESVGRYLLPLIVFLCVIFAWDRYVVLWEVPKYILPGPGLVWSTLIKDAAILLPAALVTLKVAMLALIIAVIVGAGLAIFFDLSRWVEISLYPYAVILQVTPLVAVAPLIFIYVDNRLVGLLICASVVGVFPILSNMTLGLKSTDHNLRDLYHIYGASRWQKLVYLQLPNALPHFLVGLRIAGGLSLIGAIVAEFVAGTGGIGSGLAFRIQEAGYRLNIPRMFAALLLIAASGVAIFAALSVLSHLLLRKWHESAITRET